MHMNVDACRKGTIHFQKKGQGEFLHFMSGDTILPFYKTLLVMCVLQSPASRKRERAE